MDAPLLALYRTMPKGFGCVDACIKISQVAGKDGKRRHQLFSEDRVHDWWNEDVYSAMTEFVHCVFECSDEMKFGDQLSFDDEMEEMQGVSLDVELTVTVTKITKWVFLVNVVNERRRPEQVEEENPQ